MINPSKPNRLFGFGRASKAPASQDPADLGTAFGMEVSLDQPPEEPAANDNTPGAQGGWIRRLARRREPK